MELRQLRYLVALADERQFTKAAERERVAQPALSQQIKRLERELGLPLIERGRPESTLTQAGELVVRRARRALAELEAAGTELAELQGLAQGRIVIGAMQILGLFDLVAALSAYRRRYPGVDLLVREDLSGSLVERVQSGEFDLAFLSLTDGLDPEGLALLPVAREELVAVVPPSHRIANRKRIDLGDLSDDVFIAFSEGSALRRLLVGAGGEVGFEPRITVESNEIPRVREMVSRGLGIALLPRSAVTGAGPEVRAIGFTGAPFAWKVSLAWQADRHLDPPARAFLDLVRESTEQAAVGD